MQNSWKKNLIFKKILVIVEELNIFSQKERKSTKRIKPPTTKALSLPGVHEIPRVFVFPVPRQFGEI